MSHMSKVALLLGALCVTTASAEAGWVAEWEHTPIKTNGERGTTEPATMRIDKGKVRLVQPTTTSLIDYNQSRFTVLNPGRQFFWSGTVDQYVAEMLQVRTQAAKRKRGESTETEMPKVDPKSLPPVTVTKTDESATIAGHPTQKYEIKVNDQLFEELWIAQDLDLSGDMDAKKVLDYQKKMSEVMLGNSATAYNALYRSPDYRNLLEKGFALRSITHHIAGGFERTAVQLREVEIPDSDFVVPDSYRKVRLLDVFATGETS
jgi:hypothetical protein